MSNKFYVDDNFQIYSLEILKRGDYEVPANILYGTIRNPLFIGKTLTQTLEFVKYAKQNPNKIEHKEIASIDRESLKNKQLSFENELFK